VPRDQGGEPQERERFCQAERGYKKGRRARDDGIRWASQGKGKKPAPQRPELRLIENRVNSLPAIHK